MKSSNLHPTDRGALAGGPLPVPVACATGDLALRTGETDNLLMSVRFGGAGACPEWPCARVPNRVLGGTSALEAWYSELATERGRLGPVDWAENGSILFGSLHTRLAGDLRRLGDAAIAVVRGRREPIPVTRGDEVGRLMDSVNRMQEILREREQVSQPVFARYLNVRKDAVSKWERGEKRPDGPSLKLLNLVRAKGLRAIA